MLPTKREGRLMISAELLPDHVNVVVAGVIDSNSASQFERELRELVTKGHTKISLNLEHVRLVTSAGLRVLLVIAKELYEMDGGFVLYACQPSVMEVFRITGFETILHIVEGYAHAVTSLGGTIQSQDQISGFRVLH